MPPIGHREKLTIYIDSNYYSAMTPNSTTTTANSTTTATTATTANSTTTTTTTTVADNNSQDHQSRVDDGGDTSDVKNDEEKEVRYVLGGGALDTVLALTKKQLDRVIEENNIQVKQIEESTAPKSTFSLGSVLEKREDMKFMVTLDCKRLARWLRVIGVNASTSEFTAETEYNEMFEEAEREERIILTCDKKLSARKGAIACFLLGSYDIQQQFKYVTQHFGIEFNSSKFLSICSKCNFRGFNGPLTIEEVENIIGPATDIGEKVRSSTSEFWLCRNTECNQVYWVGPKYKDADTRFKALFDNAVAEEQDPSAK